MPVDEVVIETLVDPCGVTGLLELDATEVPALFVAVTVNVYAVPFVKPVNVQDVDAVFVQPTGAVTDGDEVTVYPVIVAPPFEVGALQLSETDPLPEVPVTPVGAPGATAAITTSGSLVMLNVAVPSLVAVPTYVATPLFKM